MRPDDHSQIVLSPTQSRKLLQKRHCLEAIAVRVANERGVVAFAMAWTLAGRAIGAPAARERGRMERIDRLGAARAQADVAATIIRYRRHAGSMIEPELGIAFAKPDRPFPDLKLGKADRTEDGFIKARRADKVAHADGNVVDHET